jgi:hypothetical protein
LEKYIAYDLPRDVHETAADEIVMQIRERIQTAANSFTIGRQFENTGSATVQIGHALKEPDGGLRPV